MDKVLCVFLIILIITLLLFTNIGIFLESRDFNHGICRRCGDKLRCFDMDSQGGRLYTCDSCDYWTSVSYNCVDRRKSNRRERMKG